MAGMLGLVKPKKKRQPISFGGKDYNAATGQQPAKAPSAPSAPGPTSWQGLLNHQRQTGQPIDFGALQAAGYRGPPPGARRQDDAAKQAASPVPLADDAQAAAARAQAIFEATQQRSAIDATGALDATDLAEAVRRLRAQRPDDENAAKNAASAQGLFSSGYLVKNLGDIGSRYVRAEGDADEAFRRREAERTTQGASLDAQAQLTQAVIDAELAERQAQRDAQAAQAGTLASGPRQVAYKDMAAQGLSVAARDGRFVVLDRNGNVIPGATLHVAGKRRYVRLPGRS